MTPSPRVTVSLVIYNGEKFLPSCLAALSAQTEHNLEIIALDNASTDRSVDILKKDPRITLIKSAINLGFAAGHNTILRKAKTPLCLILNQDIILEPEYIARLIKALENTPNAASATGCLLRAQWGDKGLTKWEKSSIIDSCGIRIGIWGEPSDYLQGFPVQKAPNNKQNVWGASGAAALYKRECLEKVAYKGKGATEYFDEQFFMYKEDVDLAFRLKKAGYDAILEGSARAYHFRTRAKDSPRSNTLVNVWSYRNQWFIYYKYGILRYILFRPLFLVREVAKLGYMLLFERSTLAAWKEIVRYAKKAKKRQY